MTDNELKAEIISHIASVAEKCGMYPFANELKSFISIPKPIPQALQVGDRVNSEYFKHEKTISVVHAKNEWSGRVVCDFEDGSHYYLEDLTLAPINQETVRRWAEENGWQSTDSVTLRKKGRAELYLLSDSFGYANNFHGEPKPYSELTWQEIGKVLNV